MRHLSGIIGILILLLLTVCTTDAQAQYTTVSGNVYDISARRPLEAVAVQSTSGRGTITDSTGYYILTVLKTDSIWFSLIGKSTMKYPVDTISNLERFNVMIHVRSFDLPEVKVRNNYYRYDSAMNRQDYAKVFNFKKPSLGVVSSPNYNPGATVGFDLEGIINMFRVKRNRSILTLQKRLIEEEEEKYKIDYAEKKSKTPVFKGIKNLLEDLHNKGYLLVINTNAYSRNCLLLLEHSGIKK